MFINLEHGVRVLKSVNSYKFSVKKYDSRDAMGQAAAAEAACYIGDLLKHKQEVNCIFAAAPSQNEVLKFLCEQNIEWGRINAFHMDEYIGLKAGDPRLFRSFLDREIFQRVPFKSVHYIFSEAETAEQMISKYTALLEEYPADITFMGIGENGHIAFNDPHETNFHDDKVLKVVELDSKCRMQQVHDGCFETLNDVPKYAITLTVPPLLKAGKIYCVVPAATKAQAVFDTVNGTVSESCPASILRRHPDAMLYVDKDAGKLLE
jgi:glucosamine-6-phosphate deaminase